MDLTRINQDENPKRNLFFTSRNYMDTDIFRKNDSPILVHGMNHTIAMSTPLFKHIPPDISKFHKKKKHRKRI